MIEKCHFIWRPFNFTNYDLHKRIDKRNIRNHYLIFNHFEHLKTIGTKSGLIRSLK